MVLGRRVYKIKSQNLFSLIHKNNTRRVSTKNVSSRVIRFNISTLKDKEKKLLYSKQITVLEMKKKKL